MIRTACLLVLGLSLSAPASAQLVIAGGGLEAETQPVWQAFIDRALPEGDFVIIPSASGSPVQSAGSVRDTLIRYGVSADRIRTVPLAVRDDDSTDDVDESLWAANAADPAIAAMLDGAAAFWFTGGDQSRTTRLLYPDADDMPALTAIRAAHAKGAPIGGTSAGAAIMSRTMIRQGDSLGALTESQDGEGLELGEGLGFLTMGVVDQHFGERARLGRLAVAALSEAAPEARIGFGVDENTALIVDADGMAVVEGAGYVTVFDGRSATHGMASGRMQIGGALLHMLGAGDRIDLATLTVTPAEWKAATVGREYRDAALPGGGGMAVSGQTLQAVIGDGLLDNSASREVARVSFDGEGRGMTYRFEQTDASHGYWGRGPDGRGGYTLVNVGFAVEPVRVMVEPLDP